MVECCKKIKKGLVICLDEVDQLVLNDEEALYNLARINQYINNPVGLVLISNNPYVFVEIDRRIKSSLNLEEVEFKGYSLDEMRNILQKRAKLAFISVEEGVVFHCSEVAACVGESCDAHDSRSWSTPCRSD